MSEANLNPFVLYSLIRQGLFGTQNNASDSTFEVDDDYNQRQLEKLQAHSYAYEITQDTKCYLGKMDKPILNVLQERERRSASLGKRIHITQRFLPQDEPNPHYRNSPQQSRHSGAILDRYRSQIFGGRFSTDGSLFMSVSQDKSIRLYDTSNWCILRLILARDVGWSIIDTDYSPDQRFIAYSSWTDHGPNLCSIKADEDIHESLDFRPEAHRFCLFSIKFSPDSVQLLGGSSDQSLYLYDLHRNERTMRIEAHDDDVNTVAYLDEGGQVLLSGADDGLIKVWDQRDFSAFSPNRPVGVLEGHLFGITHISSKGDGRYLISNSKDQSIKLWDLRTMSSSMTETQNLPLWDYRYGDREVPASIRKRFTGKLVHQRDSSLFSFRGHKVFHTLIRAYFSPKETTAQRYIYTGSYDGCIYIFDTLTGEMVKRLQGHTSLVRDVSWHPYRPLLLSTSWDGCVRKWEYFH